MNGSGRTTRRVASTIVTFMVISALAIVAVPVTAGASNRASSPAAKTVAPNLRAAKGTNNLWHVVSQNGVVPSALASSKPLGVHATHATLSTLDAAGMRNVLAKAPMEFTAAARTNPVVISLPAPDGTFQRFAVVYSPIMMPGLAKKYPNIRTYAGRGIDDPTATMRLAMTPLGLSSIVRGAGTWMTGTYYHLDQNLYGSYYSHDAINNQGDFQEKELVRQADTQAQALQNSASPLVAVGSQLRIYRLALVTDPGYSNYWGGPGNVTAAKVQLMNRVNMAYENDFSYRLDLIANNNLLNLDTYAQAIGRNGPCGNAACFSLANISSCSSLGVIGPAIARILPGGASAYDIGHLALGAPGGGVAGLGVVGGNSKAQGCTGIPEPDGDYYAIDYVAHEMGHQFGMNHTFGGNLLNCSGSNRNNGTSVEPGSGSSIMAYAGICQQDDLQPHSDPYFSERSFDETQAYTAGNLANLNELQQSALSRFGGGNEVQQVTFGPGYAQASTIHAGTLSIVALSSTVGGVSELGNTVQVNTTTAHTLGVGETVTIAGVANANYNGTFTVTAVGPSSSSFQYNLPGFSNLAPSGSGTVTPATFGATESGTTVTITTTTAHNLSVGNQVTVASVGVAGYNGTFTVTAVPTTKTFQYTAATSGLANSGVGTATFNSPFQITIGGNDSVVIGGSGLPYTAANVQSAINNISGFSGTVAVTGLASTGFTVTYLGASAQTDVPSFSLTGLSCGGCFAQVAETTHGGTYDSFTMSYGGGPDSGTLTNIPTSAVQPAAAGTGAAASTTVSIGASPTGITEAGTTATVTTTSPHLLGVGESVTLAGVGVAGYNGTFTVATVPTATTFTFTATAGLGASGGGTATGAGGATESGNIVTFVTTAAHSLSVGATVTIAGVGVGGYNGTFTVLAVPSTGSFQYHNPTTGLAASGGGTETSSVTPGETESGNTVTVNTVFPHNLSIGTNVTIAGSGVAGYNGTFAVTATPTTTSFQYTDPTSGLANSGGGTATPTGAGTFTTTGVQLALQGVSEVQTVALTNYTVAGRSYTLNYGGPDSVAITRGQNNNAAGITAAIIGGNEVQTNTFANFNAANAGNSYQVQIGANLSVVLGNGGTAISNANVAAAINAISGFSGTVTVTGASNTAGPVITFGGASANTDVPTATIVFGACTGAGTPCTNTNVESVKGSAGVVPVSAGSTITVGTVADTGYTVTYNALGNVVQPTVTNGTGGVTGTVTTGTNGSAGILPAGATGVAGTLSNTGFTVTYGAALAGAQAAGATVSLLGFTNLTTGTGMFGISTKGGPATNHGTLLATGNTAPTVTTAPSWTIPYRTPFALTGSATDPDGGQTLTYMWEQNDTGTGTILTNNVKTSGALFRQFGTALDNSLYNVHVIPTTFCSNGENCTTTNPTRVFPDMAQILSGNTNAATGSCPQAGTYLLYPLLIDCYSEFLPTTGYAGPMHFRLTVRDGALGAGGVDSASTTVNLAPGTGPFLVTSQGTPVSYLGASSQAVTWNVAGTTAAPISAANVDILFSSDGGATFPTVLAAGTANDGTENVTMPDVATSQARIKIQATGNIFFDVNDSNFTIQQSQTITFGALANKTWGDADFNVSATASSGLPVTFTVGGTDQCTIAGTLVHITGAGSCTVTAHQAGDATHQPAPDVPQTFTISKANQTITFPAIGNRTYGDADFNVSATSDSGLTVTFTSTGDCTVAGTLVHITGAGSCTVHADQAGDSNYFAAPQVDRTFSIAKANQSIAFSVANHTYGDPDFLISATATSGLTVSFSVLSGTCTVVGNTVHITGAGNCTIRASQGGNTNYNPAPNEDRTFNVFQASQTITFPSIPTHTWGDPNFNVSATSDSGLTVTFTAVGDCTVAGTLVHITGAGSCTVTAHQPGDINYNPASDVNRTFTINQANQTINGFNAITNRTYGAPDFNVTGVTATSGLPVAFTASPGSVCTVSGSTVHIVGGGVCTVHANQGGNINYNPAPQVDRAFTVNPQTTTITLSNIVPASVQTGKKATFKAKVQGSGSSPVGLTVEFRAGATVIGTAVVNSMKVAKAKLTVALPPGSYSIKAWVVATANFASSTSTGKPLSVTP